MIFINFSYHFAAILSGLVLGIGFVFFIFRLDDLIFDLLFWANAIKRSRELRKYGKLTVGKLREKPEQRVAIFIPCWKEYEVVDRMLDFACRSLEYRNYEIFVGVYPNDQETIDRVNYVSQTHPQVRPVINPIDGPTTKAQNLNSMFRAMTDEEGADQFQIIVLHDTEDIIHPLSLLMYNYLMPAKEMVQLPVFPLERPWTKWTAWTYADEFAQNHLKDVIFREQIGGFVPSAGVGCAFSRPALEIVHATSEDLFPSGTLTEDYQIALRLHTKGLKTIFVHQQLAATGKRHPATAAAYVATRAYFPDTVRDAIKQKSRWVAGICFQAWHMTGWTGNFATRYGLYRDRKSILANTLVLLGYIVLILIALMMVWHAFDPNVYLPSIGTNHVIWAMLDFVLIMTLIELLQSAWFVAWVYGPLQGILSIFRPPLAGFINGIATLRAGYAWYQSRRTGQAMKWSKTAHFFPTETALSEFRRQIGQILIDQNKLSADQLHLALEEQQHSREALGETLVRLGFVQERDVVEAFAEQTGTSTALHDDLVPEVDMLLLIPEEVSRRLVALPLRLEHGAVVLAVAQPPGAEDDAELRRVLARPFTLRVAEKVRLCHAIDRSYQFNDERRKPIGKWLVDRGFLTRASLLEMLDLQRATDKPLLQLLSETGTLDEIKLYDVLQDYFGVATMDISTDVNLSDEDFRHLPTDILSENEITIIRRGDKLFAASAFPLAPGIVERLSAGFGQPLTQVLARKSAVLAARRMLLERAGLFAAVT
ncbi:MAG: glycosyl transferase family protein [Candidatus Baltobacteraceae bacterium]